MNQLKVPVVNRIDSVSNWSRSKYVPLEGELVIGTQGTDAFIKIGDGTHTWSELNYYGYQKPKVPGTKIVNSNITLDVNDIDLILVNKDNINITLPSNPYDGKEYTFKTFPEWFNYNILAPGKKIFYSKKYQYWERANLGAADSTITVKYSEPLNTWIIVGITKT